MWSTCLLNDENCRGEFLPLPKKKKCPKEPQSQHCRGLVGSFELSIEKEEEGGCRDEWHTGWSHYLSNHVGTLSQNSMITQPEKRINVKENREKQRKVNWSKKSNICLGAIPNTKHQNPSPNLPILQLFSKFCNFWYCQAQWMSLFLAEIREETQTRHQCSTDAYNYLLFGRRQRGRGSEG